MNKNETAAAQVLWDFHYITDISEPCDYMIVFGGNDIRVAEHAVQLYFEGLSKFAICSGGIAHQTDLLRTSWDHPEADEFSKIMINSGVPKANVILERHATNTAENISLSRQLLLARGIQPEQLLLVTKPHMQRRVIATFGVECPDVKAILSSQNVTFIDFCRSDEELLQVTNLMVGDLQRLSIYGEKGFCILQSIPNTVMTAFNFLVRKGFTNHLIN